MGLGEAKRVEHTGNRPGRLVAEPTEAQPPRHERDVVTDRGTMTEAGRGTRRSLFFRRAFTTAATAAAFAPLVMSGQASAAPVDRTATAPTGAGNPRRITLYEVTSDGTRMNDSVVEPGGRRIYVWRTHAQGRRTGGTIEPGSAGYWHYHDHVVGSDHGTGGIKKGLYGPLVVRRRATCCRTRRSPSSSTTC
ncbi:hypothetical protein [Microbispora sp. NPDC049633]|uniref:hypothetical protein n=1 Tax=Microbispora sp. NPDC049633 TaxID=3154355 RepID=UPI003420B2FB